MKSSLSVFLLVNVTELQFGVPSFLQTCFRLNIAVISFDHRKPDKTEEEEPQDPCPYCSNEVPQTKLDCPECKNTIPYCIITVSNAVLPSSGTGGYYLDIFYILGSSENTLKSSNEFRDTLWKKA